MIKYLDIDSTYRNRNQFPNPGQFNVINSQNGNNMTLSTSLDPISTAAPIITYIPSTLNLSGNIQIVSSSTDNKINIYFDTSYNASKTTNYFRGATLISPSNYGGPVKIDTWDYLNTSEGYDYFVITFTPSLDDTAYHYDDPMDIICATDFSQGYVFIPSGPLSSQFYRKYYIYNETRNEYSQIISYDGQFALASIEAQPSWSLDDTISLRQQLPLTYGNFQSGSTNSVLVLSASSNPSRGAYNGTFLRLTQSNTTVNIISYFGAPTFQANINVNLPTPPSENEPYEILSFTRDNFYPLIYTGTHIQQECCYEVQSINLLIPNVGVIEGGVMAGYPYFYVELQNYTTANSGIYNMLYSNNPNAVKKLFRVPVTNISPARLNAYVKTDKSYMVETIKINPYNSFKFGIYLPDGRPLILSIPDTKSPLPPNPYLQITALFSLKQSDTD